MRRCHPLHTYMKENRQAEKIAAAIEGVEVKQENIETLSRQVEELSTINLHYLRKENQLFPLLEKRGVSGPSTVMWAIHDDIRQKFKAIRASLAAGGDDDNLEADIAELIRLIRDMIYKEERILFPMALETLSQQEWIKVKQGEEEIGFSWIKPDTGWGDESMKQAEKPQEQEGLTLDTGSLTSEQVNLVLNHLPVEVSFVDENDEVRFYSHCKGERIFPRSPGVIGRKVQNCHPKKSVHMVEKILEEFRAGRKEAADFWITLDGRLILIRYFAVRDGSGRYKGTLEVTQDITDIQALKGEKRLLDWQ